MLPDIVRPGLALVIVGTAVGTASAARRHYYAGRGNRFWSLLHESSLVPERLGPEDDQSLLEHGVGLTDLNKTVAQSHDRGLRYDVAAFAERIAEVQPRWVAFNGLTAGKEWARAVGRVRPSLGIVPSASVAGARVFVLPNSSGANTHQTYPQKLEWWSALAELVAAPGSGAALRES